MYRFHSCNAFSFGYAGGMDEQYGDEVFYHTASGNRVLPADMSIHHLRNAKAKLELKEEDDCAIYQVIVDEIKKRNNEKT